MDENQQIKIDSIDTTSSLIFRNYDEKLSI